MLRKATCRSGGVTGSGQGRSNYYGGPPAVPTAHEPSEDARRRGMIWLGVVVLIGFLMPLILVTWRETKVVFLNFEVFGRDEVPAGIKLFCLYPGIAGVVVILLAALSRGVARSAVVAGLGVLFVLLLVVLEDEKGMGFFQGFFGEAPAGASASLLLFLLAFLGLFIGSRARCHRPASQVAAIIGIVGGILYGVNLLLPVLPEEAGTLQLIAPFKMIEHGRESGAVIMAVGLLGMMACLISSSVLCILNIAHRPNAQGIAQKAFLLLVLAFVVLGGAVLVSWVVAVSESSRPGRGDRVGAELVNLAKMVCWLAGMLLLIPVGLTDLLVNLTPPGPAPAGHGPATPPSGTLDDPPARLAKLKKLLDDGLITPEEYERGKSEIMARL
jgi:hypothetical protein